jgi:hypothetical protein
VLAISTHDNVDLGTISVSEVEFDDSVLFVKSNETVAEVQPVRAMRRTEHTLQVCTVNADKGRPEAATVGTAWGNRKCRDPTAVAPSAPNQFARFCGKCGNGIETPEALKFSRSVSGQTTAAPISRNDKACS